MRILSTVSFLLVIVSLFTSCAQEKINTSPSDNGKCKRSSGSYTGKETTATIYVLKDSLFSDSNKRKMRYRGLGLLLESGDGGTPTYIPPETTISLNSWKKNASNATPVLRNAKAYEPLINFNLQKNDISNKMESAWFGFRPNYIEKVKPYKITFHRMLTPWDKSATWNSSSRSGIPWNGMRPGKDYEKDPFAELNVADPQKAPEFVDFSNAVKKWISGEWKNYGFTAFLNGGAMQVNISVEQNVKFKEWDGRAAKIKIGGDVEKHYAFELNPVPLNDIDLGNTSKVSSISFLMNISEMKGKMMGHSLVFRKITGNWSSKPEKSQISVKPILSIPLNSLKKGLNGIKNLKGILNGGAPYSCLISIEGPRPLPILSFASPTIRHLFKKDGKYSQMKITLREPEKLDLHPKVRPESGFWVHRVKDNFVYKNKPIRFTGFNIHTPTTYLQVDNLVERLRNMNINAVRLWPTSHPFYSAVSAKKGEMLKSKKGDGSKLDVYDYLVFKLQNAGMFIHNTALGYMTSTEWENWPNLSIRLERKNKKGYDHLWYNVVPIMPYLDKECLAARIKHIENYLKRVNPYTNQTYAELPVFASWELTNENHTVAYILEGRFEKWSPIFKNVLEKRWNEWLQKKYGSTKALVKAWGKIGDDESLEKINIKPAPTYKQIKDYPKGRANDFVEFVENLFIDGSRELETAARGCAPKGEGINIAPIVYNTHADLNMHAQYANSGGDFVSVGAYQTPFTVDKSKKFYPWKPFFSERPYFYNFNFQTIRDKPFVVYENSFFRPYHYRAEWSTAVSLLGAGLGWDSIYYYFWGTPTTISDRDYSNLSFSATKLAIPTSSSHDGYCFGFHHGNDEVLTATIALTAQAFINGIKPNSETSVVTFGPTAFRDMRYKNYSCSGKKGSRPDKILAGGDTEWYTMPNIYRKFMHTSVRKRLLLDFDEKQKAPIRVSGELCESTALMDGDRDKLHPSPDIIWDPENNHIVLDCAHSKIITGILKNGYKFKGGVSISGINRDFAFFGISARDGKKIKDSDDLILTLVGKSHNTGYKYNPSKIQHSTLGMIDGVENPGTAPVIVDRLEATITIPPGQRILKCYNFAGYCYRKETINGKFKISKDEPLFLARISK